MSKTVTTAAARAILFRQLHLWQSKSLGHQMKRRFILTGRFQALHDKLIHERSEIARRKFGPSRPYEPSYGYGRMPLQFWSRRASAWRDAG